MAKLIIDNRTELSDADALTYVISVLDHRDLAEKEKRNPPRTSTFRKHYGGRETIFVNYDRMADGDLCTVFT